MPRGVMHPKPLDQCPHGDWADDEWVCYPEKCQEKRPHRHLACDAHRRCWVVLTETPP